MDWNIRKYSENKSWREKFKWFDKWEEKWAKHVGYFTYFVSLDPLSVLWDGDLLHHFIEEESTENTSQMTCPLSCFGAPVFPAPRPMFFFCGIGLEKPGMGTVTRVRKPFSHLGYSRHCDECLDYITTGNSPTKLMKKVLLFPFYRWADDGKRD